jgi:16S rRNA (cytosine967-C5)-methyltransferase
MKPGARMAAAVDILTEILERHRPAAVALADWGRASRFAGSGDRSAIGTLVYDVLRRKASLAAAMGEETPRALALAAGSRAFGISADAVAGLADGSRFALAPLSEHERAGLNQVDCECVDAPDHVRGDLPEWLAPSLGRVFGARLVAEGQALARRAPIDLRTNTLKATREKVIGAFAKSAASETPWTPTGVRIPAPEGGGRAPNVEADPAHGRGWFEVQDEGSQLAAALARAGPRMQVLDICAGAGGKTLALGAAMRNTGQIYAYDVSKYQLRPIFERLKRAGIRNAQVMTPGDEAALLALGPRFDLVFVDAPCTGSGVWRRRPDAKWRLKPANLEERLVEQRDVLSLAQRLVKPGGRLVYVTCSLLPEENGDQAGWFRESHPMYTSLPFGQAWRGALDTAPPASADGDEVNLLVTPASHDTDGFFVAIFERSADTA